MWIALQKMDRLKVELERATAPEGRLAAARAMSGAADEVRDLTAEVLAEAGQTQAAAA